jgi:hypothetical protein
MNIKAIREYEEWLNGMPEPWFQKELWEGKIPPYNDEKKKLYICLQNDKKNIWFGYKNCGKDGKWEHGKSFAVTMDALESLYKWLKENIEESEDE